MEKTKHAMVWDGDCSEKCHAVSATWNISDFATIGKVKMPGL